MIAQMPLEDFKDICDTLREVGATDNEIKSGDIPGLIRKVVPQQVVEFSSTNDNVQAYIGNVFYREDDDTQSLVANYVFGTDGDKPKPFTAYAYGENNIVVADASSVRQIACPYARNVRDIGGWTCEGGTIKFGKVIRGSYVKNVDRPVLVEQFNIAHDIDLRGYDNVFDGSDPNSSPLGVDYWHYMGGAYINYGRVYLANGSSYDYTENPTAYNDCARATFQKIFECILADEPIYLHCTAGADRTGTICYMLESLIGTDHNAKDKDYEITTFRSGTSSASAIRARNEEDWISLKNVFRNNFEGRNINEKVYNWFRLLGFSEETIDAVKSHLVEA